MPATRRSMIAATLAAPLPALAQPSSGSAPRDVAATLAPSGTLRVAINYGNPVLAQRDPAGGEPRGVSADLARELARRLGLPMQVVPFDAAGRVTEALRADAWDICFLAIDPVRAQGIAFTAPYVVIEGAYLVRQDSPIRENAEVDRPGIRVAVGRGSAYDLFLTRELRHATIIRAPTSPASLEYFRRDNLEVAANVKQPLVAYARANPDVRVLPGRFQVIEQAVGIPAGRAAALPWLRAFVEEMKASGFVARSLAASGQSDAEVAPPAS
ncbi:ABC transporter substrate-binding protein [Falsiroseomonas oryziterrae]|uniref:ABC transporter substrate-binding protein n=1 Tax=Falsiroseomonas oryziterrae TaxID=2911368 RepID=UPI001F1CD024|nr:ABC transporter substrate-binding protein [Roseomonas sp. NPKOSM-4]